MRQKGSKARQRSAIAVIVAVLMAVAYIPNIGISVAEEMPDQNGSQTEAGLNVNCDAGGADEQQPGVSVNEDADDPAETAAPEKESGEKADGSVSGKETAEPDKDAEEGDSSGDVQSTDKPDKDAAEEAAGDPGDAKVLTAKGKTFKVTVTCGRGAKIPKGSTLHVKEIKSSTAKYKECLDKAAEELEQTDSGLVSSARFFDIEIHDADGNKIEPEAEVSVKIDLDDAPRVSEEELTVVHFEKDGPVIMDSKTDKDENICFDTEAFSTYGIIVTPEPTSVDDLDGFSFTLDRQGRYITSQVLDNVGDPKRLGKSWNQSDAAVWTFEKSGEGYGYTFYNISTTVNGQKRYLHIDPVWYNHSMSHTTLETSSTVAGCPQDFAVDANSDNTYTIFIVLPNDGWRRVNLNEWNQAGGNGFAGYDRQTNEDHLNMTLVSDKPTTNIRETNEYAVIVKDESNNKYYAVQEEGKLVEVEYDETTGRARVKLEKPILWTYTSVWDGLNDGPNGTINYNAGDDHPNQEPYNLRMAYDARTISGYTQLTETYYYRYISPGSGDGLAEESTSNPSHGWAKWANGIRYENNTVHGIVWNNNTNSFDNTNQYIGADFTNMTITGGQSAANAAKVFLAVIEEVPEPSSDNETVNHIDIGIVAKGHLKAPLAYGNYYDKDGNLILTVTPDHQVTLELEKDIDITKEDIMNATLKAYKDEACTDELNNAYYIDGYSSNEHTTHSTVQVRMEGSFKVSTLKPYDDWYDRSNDDPNRRSNRLQHQVYYKISTNKNVTFPLVYNGTQLYNLKGEKLEFSDDMDITAKFNYWRQNDPDDPEDNGNECPVVQSDFEATYHMTADWWYNQGRNNRNWASGAIIDNDYSTPYGQDPFPGISGMDFVLYVHANANAKPAIEIKKHIVDSDGNVIKPAEDVTNKFSIYTKPDGDPSSVGKDYAVLPNKADDLADKQAGFTEYDTVKFDVPGGKDSEGSAIYYDYDVQPGMVYVKEDDTAMAEDGDNHVITDVDGNIWTYKETRVETEYVWRQDGDDGKVHTAKGYSAVPEVLGDYTVDGEKLYNGFLEFHVYNVYEPKLTKLKLSKELDPQIDLPEEGENATMVFEITGTDSGGEEIYHNQIGLTFNEESGKYESRVIEDVPANAEISVKEIYGGNYKPAGDNPKVAELGPIDPDDPDSEQIWVVEFENTPNDNPGYGSGVVNKYTTKDGVKYEKEADK